MFRIELRIGQRYVQRVGNAEIKIACLREELKREREQRVRLEREAKLLRDELDRAREFLDLLPALGCSLEAFVAVQEFLMTSPTIASGKPR